MKVSVFLAIILVTGLTSQYASAHPEAGLPDGFASPGNCNYSAVEGVWRINTKGQQSTMNSGAYLSFARSKHSTSPQPAELEFAVTGNGFGKIKNTPVFFKGSCENQNSLKVYVLRGTIEVVDDQGNSTEQTVTVTPHPADIHTDREDYCEAQRPQDESVCKSAVLNYQTRYISIDIADVKRPDNSGTIETAKQGDKDPGAGHAHGGGSN